MSDVGHNIRIEDDLVIIELAADEGPITLRMPPDFALRLARGMTTAASSVGSSTDAEDSK